MKCFAPVLTILLLCGQFALAQEQGFYLQAHFPDNMGFWIKNRISDKLSIHINDVNGLFDLEATGGKFPLEDGETVTVQSKHPLNNKELVEVIVTYRFDDGRVQDEKPLNFREFATGWENIGAKLASPFSRVVIELNFPSAAHFDFGVAAPGGNGETWAPELRNGKLNRIPFGVAVGLRVANNKFAVVSFDNLQGHQLNDKAVSNRFNNPSLRASLLSGGIRWYPFYQRMPLSNIYFGGGAAIIPSATLKDASGQEAELKALPIIPYAEAGIKIRLGRSPTRFHVGVQVLFPRFNYESLVMNVPLPSTTAKFKLGADWRF